MSTALSSGSVSTDTAAAMARINFLAELWAAEGSTSPAPAALGTASPTSSFASLLAANTPSAQTATAAPAATAPGAGTYAPVIAQAAAQYGIDPALLYGVIRQESAFDPNAVSSAGAEGIAQIMPENFASLGVTDPFDPVQSINAAAKLLSENLATFGGNTVDAVAAYNAGAGAVQTYGGVPPYPETQNYVQQVLGYMAQYSSTGQYASSAQSPYAAVTGSGTAPVTLSVGESTDNPVVAASYPWSGSGVQQSTGLAPAAVESTAAYPAATYSDAGSDSDTAGSTDLYAGQSTNDPLTAAQYPWAPQSSPTASITTESA